MTFNDLFEKKDLENNIVNLTLNKNFVCPDFEENFDGDDELFSMKMKKEYADKFINYLSIRFKSIDRLTKHLEGTYTTSYDGFTDLFFIFAKNDLRIKMTLFDYCCNYNIQDSLNNHIGFGFDLPIKISNQIEGSAHIDDCIIDFEENLGNRYFKINTYNPANSIRINIEKEAILKQIKIYFIEKV